MQWKHFIIDNGVYSDILQFFHISYIFKYISNYYLVYFIIFMFAKYIYNSFNWNISINIILCKFNQDN